MPQSNSYIPEEPWEAYLESIKYRYPYVMPPAQKKRHPKVTINGVEYEIPGGIRIFSRGNTV